MKKIVTVASMAVLAAGLTFADAGITVGGWGRIENTVTGDSSSSSLGSGPSWAGADNVYGRVGVVFNGHSDNVGFSLNVDSNGNTLAVGDQAKITVKASDMVTIQLGKIQGDVLRGTLDDLYDTMVDSTGKDDIFKRFYPNSGALLDLNLVPGLYIGAAVDAYGEDTKNVGEATQVGVGYTIEGLGLIRAQIVGQYHDDAFYQAAFDFTAVPKLNIDTGVKYFTDNADGLTVSSALNYDGVDKTNLQARFQYVKDDVLVAGQAGYNVDGPLFVGAGASADKLTSSSVVSKVAGFAKLGYSNGYGKVAFVYTIQDGGNTWSIPCNLEYWF